MKNSHGYDEISTKLLKIRSPSINSPLTHMCNKLSPGIFPDCLKYSEIQPLFTKGDKLNVSNYRPISLLLSFSNVLEKSMYIQLLECNNISAEEQFAFRTKSTTSMSIYKLTTENLKALNNKMVVAGIF